MRGPPGEDYGGVREPFFCRRNEDQGLVALSFDLARRPGWGGGSLRACRRAKVIVEAVPLALGVLWEAFGDPWGALWDPLGGLWRSFRSPWGSLGGLVGLLGGSWGVLGVSLRLLVASGAVSGIFREIPGRLLRSFWLHFSDIFQAKFGLRLWIVFWLLLESFWESFGSSFGGVFGSFFGLI